MSQVPLCGVVKKINSYRKPRELFKIIDFGVFTKDYKDLLLLIEIRDKQVRNICCIADINLITYYSNMHNEKYYFKNRLINEMIKCKSNVKQV